MFHQAERNWIGFQETQKTICSLKKEVEIVEKKIRNAKRSFIKQTAKGKGDKDSLPYEEQLTKSQLPDSKEPNNKYFSKVKIAEKKNCNAKRSFIKQTTKGKRYKDCVPSEEQLTKSQLPKSKESNNQHFSKEKNVPYTILLPRDEHETVPKKIFCTSEEEPDILPDLPLNPLTPHIGPLDFKFLISSFDYLPSTTEDSASVSDGKHSSSERTSSLIASTYREDDKLFKKCGTKGKVVTADVSESFTTETSEQENNYKENKMLSTDRSLHNKVKDMGMEWKDGSKNRAFFLQNKFKTDNNHLKAIIDRQKKRQELYQMQLEQDVLGGFEPACHANINRDQFQQSEHEIKDDQVLSLPVRKVCTVKSLPNYKGFSAPSKNLSNKRRKQRNKHTIANTSNFKNHGINLPKRIKATVKSENDIVSDLHGKDVNKLKISANKDESFSKAVDNMNSEVLKSSSIQDKVLENKKNNDDKPLKKDTNLKTDIQSILNDNQLSDDDSLDDVKDTTFSYDVPLQAVSTVGDNNQNIVKENKKPVKSKSTKKIKTSQEQVVTSPKIRHYDVQKVREYIKKKKEERRRRHLEEHKKKTLEAQKKKADLDKLIEYQKQNVKAVAKVKPLSPAKISPKDNLISRDNESAHPRNEHTVQSSTIQDMNGIQEKDKTASSDSNLKRKFLEDIQRKDDSVRNQVNISNSQKKRQDNVHIDISIPKFISVSVTPASVHQTTKNAKSNLISPDAADVEPLKDATRSEVTKPLVKSPVQEAVVKTTECKDTSMDIDDSDIFKTINSSSISTPSGISQMTGINSKLIEEIKFCEDSFPETKQRKNGKLKKMVETINVITEPLEPFLYTKEWLSKSPLPPRTMQSRISRTSNFSKQQQLQHSVKNNDIQLNSSQPKDFKGTSFKEQVSGIGDVSQLYGQILGKKSTNEVMPVSERQSTASEDSSHLKTHQYLSNEDEIIEGSLKSDAEYISDPLGQRNLETRSEASNLSSAFSDLQKENIVPDPFNFINTLKKKPLGFNINNGKEKCKGVSSKISSSKIPFEEIYKSLLNTSSEETKPSENFINETSQDFSHNAEEVSSFIPDSQNENFILRKNPPTKISSNTSDNSKISSSKSSNTTSKRLSEKSSSSKHSSSKSEYEISETHTNKSNIHEISEKRSHVQVASHNTTAKRVMSQAIENIPDVNSSNLSEMILSGTINSEYTLEAERDSPAAVSNVHSSNASDVILSGTIKSEYTLDMDGEESGKEEVNEVIKEHSNEKASASESSISEVISVVENSKGFRSSAEDLLSNGSMAFQDFEHSAHYSANDNSISIDKDLEKHASEGSAKLQSDHSSASNQQSISAQSSKSLKGNGELTAVSQKNDQFQTIPSGSQNSVTIDFRQPLRLALSNGESVQANQGINMQECQYLHTQVVTRVASEAAAAAATSAVIAVFETQKALLSEKNPFGIINAYGRSSSSKKTQYSSDFESSADAKSSSPSSHSSAVDTKHSDLIAEDAPAPNNNEISPRSESVEEQILSNHSDPNQMAHSKSSHSSSIKIEGNQPSVYSESIGNAGQKTSERSRRKISSNISSPSPASLSENGSATTETSMSSHSNLSHLSEPALSDDLFTQLTMDVVREMTQEEELRSSQQLVFLKCQEEALVKKARHQMTLLESLKKKLRQKGAEKKVSAIKKKQKELILRLRQERAHLQCMQEAYRSTSEKHHSFLKDKKKLLKEPSLLAFELLSKEEKPSTSKYPEQKLKEFYVQKSSSSTPSLVSENDEKNMIDEDSASEVPEMLKGLASNSSQESVIDTQPSEFTKTAGSSQNKSQRSSPNPPFSPINAAPSNSNPTILSSNSLESVLQGLKKLEASKRHLTKREQRILQRRKKVEHLLQWQKKLDNEEMAVRELEKKALDIVDHSRKKTKYYVLSSASTNQNDDKRRELNYESLPPSSETPSQLSKQSEKSPVQYSSQSEHKALKTTSDESIHTNLSGNELEEGNDDDDKGNVRASGATHSSASLPEEIKSASGESSIQTVEAIENGSQAEEVVSEEISNQVSYSVKDKSSNSDVYSESFESTVSKKSLSALSISPPFKNSSPSNSIKKDCGPGIRLPLVPRNLRRHDSSGSDDSYTISQSETASDQSDIEVRIHALSEELKRRKAEAEKLKKEQKKKNRERLKEKELSLQKQLEAYNQYIHQAKLELDQQIESAVSPYQSSDVVVKPRIKWPRPEKIVDSRQIRKQASLSPDTFGLEKKMEIINSSPEVSENYEIAATKEKDEGAKKLFPGSSAKTNEENINKEFSEKSTDDSKEVSEALSVSASSKVQEASEIMRANSVSSEILSEMNESVSLSSTKSQDFSETKSLDSDLRHPAVVSSLNENKTSLDRSDSKSQTDTFTSESTSSKTSDVMNSLQLIEENSVSNKITSSDGETSILKAKETSKDLSEKSKPQLSSNTSHEVNSSEDSVSEIPSVNNSVSVEEELDCESSSKNSKCNSSEGCEIPSVKEFIDCGSEQGKLSLDVFSKGNEMCVSDGTLPPVCQVKKEKKRTASESEVVNIVNYVSTSLINDALHNLFEISNERGILRSFLNHKSHENKLQVEAQCVKEKTTEALVDSLLNLHLNDAFTTLFKILENQRTKSKKSELLFTNSADMKCVVQTATPISSLTMLDGTSMIIEETSELPLNHLSRDINSNQIFAEPATLNVNYLATSESEQQFQQQQLLLQQYSYFYRKIPNKPPPPYTPPSSPVLSSDFPFVKENKVEKITTVKKVTKHIHEVLDHALEVILDGKSKGLPLYDISLPNEDINFDKLELSTPSQSVFVDFVFDLTKEIILEKFSETEQVPQPWLRPRKLTPKSLIPSSKEVIRKSIQKDIEKALRINEDPKNLNKRKHISWSALKLGRKKRDFVDTILISELKEEEPDWVNYDQDEVTVKLQIADSIFNVLINDTVCTIKNLQQKLHL